MKISNIYPDNLKNLSVAAVRKRLANYINGTSHSVLSKSIVSILGHPLSKVCFKPDGFTNSTLATMPELDITDETKWTTWLYALFSAKKEDINFCMDMKEQFETYFLKNDFQYASMILDDLENTHGVTLWGIQNRISLLCASGKNEAALEYAELVSSENSQYIIKYIVEKIMFKFEVKSISTYTASMNDIFHEIRSTKTPYFADFFSTIFLPRGYDKNRKPSQGYKTASRFPVFDQYLYFKHAMSEAFFSGVSLKDIERHLSPFKSILSDQSIRRFCSLCNGVAEYDNNTMSVLKLYTEGLYGDCIDLIESIWDKQPTSTQYVEIYAKSCAYIGRDVPSKSLLYDLAGAMCEAIMIKDDCQYHLNNIENSLVKSYPQSWTLPLFAQLYNLFGIHHGERGVIYSQVNCFAGVPTTPKYLSIAADGKTSCDWCKTTLDILRDSDPTITIHPSRAVRYELKKAINDCDEEKCTLLMAVIESRASELLKCEYVSLKSELLLRQNKYDSLVELIANECMINFEMHRCLPIKQCIEKYTQDEICHTNELLFSIVCYVYVKAIEDSSLYLLQDSYDDFIDLSGGGRPSEIFSNRDGLNEYEMFFLENICIPSVMDVSSSFDGSLDVLSERIQIIDLLARSGRNIRDLQKERSALIDEIVVSQGTVGYDKSRIYIDFKALTKSRLSEYKSLYESYLKAPSSGGDQMILPGKGRTALPVGEKEKILHDIVIKFLHDFVRHPDHGLDRSLCADIRHGSFGNQIRSRFELHRLVTDIDEYGCYQANAYWKKEYNFVSSVILVSIDKLLAEFSEKIDSAISAANEWMRVTFEYEDKIHVFNYYLSSEEFRCLGAFLCLTTEFNGFCDEIEKFCWDRTHDCLAVMQKRLNEDFSREINSAFDWLILSIKSIKSDFPFVNLIGSINRARSGFQEDLAIVSDWFKVTNAYDFGAHSLSSLIDIAKKCFLTMKSNQRINFTGMIDTSDFTHRLTDKESRAMITSMITAFDNAIKHGGHIGTPEIQVHCEAKANEFVVKISNRMKQSSSDQVSIILENLREKIQNFGDNEMMFTEGGTGVYKINNLLNMASSRFVIEFANQDDHFVLEINGVFNEIAHDRRQ